MMGDAAQPGLWTTMGNIALIISIGGNLALVIALFRKNTIAPQPFEVKHATEFVRKEDCQNRHKESETRIVQVERQLADLRLERHNDATLLHEKVNKVGERVAGLESETQQQNGWLQRIDAKIDLLSRRV